MSQDELAAAVRTTRETISSLEQGRSAPSLPLACAIARELRASVEELFRVDELR
ncbi:MAG: Helix-turn-helix domain [Gaiellaceae bacterium]|nr:Helix-turn-helix domain [Gaiellaceae bacterium]